jgi:hypothetical protein
MGRAFYKDALGWGFVLWFVGYALGFALFPIAPLSMLGWIIMPIGVALALWILLKKVKGDSFRYYTLLGIVWLLIAVVCDYIFLVMLLKPADGYYKLDVYLYYALTLLLPLVVGWRRTTGAK